MITVQNPQKKNNCYACRIATKEGSAVRVKVNAAKCISRGQSTITLQIIDDKAAADRISEIDASIRAITLAKNRIWFNNTLEPESMDSMFRSALNTNTQHMTVLVSEVKEPSIYVDGALVDIARIGVGDVFSVDLEARGLYFYPNKFGVRWIVRRMHISTGALEDPSDDWADDEKHDVEAFWRKDIVTVKTAIDTSIDALVDKIGVLEELKITLDTELAAAEACKTLDGVWQTHLNKLSAICTKYLGGNFIY